MQRVQRLLQHLYCKILHLLLMVVVQEQVVQDQVVHFLDEVVVVVAVYLGQPMLLVRFLSEILLERQVIIIMEIVVVRQLIVVEVSVPVGEAQERLDQMY